MNDSENREPLQPIATKNVSKQLKMKRVQNKKRTSYVAQLPQMFAQIEYQRSQKVKKSTLFKNEEKNAMKVDKNLFMNQPVQSLTESQTINHME